jgi:hypothetical protein
MIVRRYSINGYANETVTLPDGTVILGVDHQLGTFGLLVLCDDTSYGTQSRLIVSGREGCSIPLPERSFFATGPSVTPGLRYLGSAKPDWDQCMSYFFEVAQ